MSPTASLLVLLAGTLLVVLALVAAFYDARRRRAAAPPIHGSRSRSAPLFTWSGNGEYRGFRYAVARLRERGRSSYLNASVETIAIEAPVVAVRFLVDASYVYRSVSDLFHAVKVKDAIAAPDLAPFWRSDERERLQTLVRDERFARILEELRSTPDFAAFAAAAAADPRIPLGSPARSLPKERDVLILTRSGSEVPYRDDHDVERDLEILTRLREPLVSTSFSDALERARVPTTLGTLAGRAFETIAALLVAIAAIVLLIIYGQNC